jgi:hypothetical protein
MVHDKLLDASHLEAFQTLILPNIAALSTEQCDQLRQFVARGGGIVATRETSLYDEWGVRRKDFGLADLFGAAYDGGEEGPQQNSYWNIGTEPNPLTRGLEDASRIINGVNRVRVRPREASVYSPLTLVPSYPDLPMEEVYARTPRTNVPGVFARQTGKGRVVYFPWDIDRTFWEVLAVDHGKLLKNAVLWATNEEPPLQVSGPGMLDVAVWEQKESMTVHLVNLTNPMTMKGPIREIIPIPAQQIRVAIPKGRNVRGSHLLVAERKLPFRYANGFLTAEIPSIGLHEVVAIDF